MSLSWPKWNEKFSSIHWATDDSSGQCVQQSWLSHRLKWVTNLVSRAALMCGLPSPWTHPTIIILRKWNWWSFTGPQTQLKCTSVRVLRLANKHIRSVFNCYGAIFHKHVNRIVVYPFPTLIFSLYLLTTFDSGTHHVRISAIVHILTVDLWIAWSAW